MGTLPEPAGVEGSVEFGLLIEWRYWRMNEILYSCGVETLAKGVCNTRVKTHDREVRVHVAPVEVEQVLLGLTIWERVLRIGELKDLVLRLEL